MISLFRNIALLVPALSIVTGAIYFNWFYIENREWLSVLHVSDYLNQAIQFLPFNFLLAGGGFLLATVLRPPPRASESSEDYGARTGWGTPFGIWSERWIPRIVIVSVGVGAIMSPQPLQANLISVFVYMVLIGSILKVYASYIEIKRETYILHYSLIFGTFALLAGTVWDCERERQRIRDFNSGSLTCEATMCVAGNLMVDEVNKGFLVYGAGQLMLVDENTGNVIASGPFSVGDGVPIVCSVPILGSWFGDRCLIENQGSGSQTVISVEDIL